VLRVNTIIDAATLTGAQAIATGKRHAAVYCSTEASENRSVRAGRFSGDLTHPLPYAPEFWRHEFRSAVADMSNNVSYKHAHRLRQYAT
jgi:probable aminopeptidase NPEPL1